ncbi:malonate--CoA ligase [Mameliella alba]|uniref:malonate--CoA ligase n=1 Tax=Mameliella alba TaxID=561184 RepID=UPI000B536CED|nr:malonyl-CoA synthase [Mameliella alba]MBY6117789.1 malonyl-CoA synthase [Mameliella alba]OWV44433.1 malonyl-CoA synthase [Mameliella alba]OWV65157.1 malonyl-CoA synthase [Mameliella alba]
MTCTIHDLFETQCRDKGNKILFERPGLSSMTFSEAWDRVLRFASLLEGSGVRPGDRVAVQVDKSAEAVLLYLACLRVGAVFLPLNTAYTGAEIDYFLGDAEPRLFVCTPATLPTHAARASETLAVESLGAAGDGTLIARAAGADQHDSPVPCKADDPAAILYTSGTTGRSKGAVLTHGNLASNAKALNDIWHFTQDDKLIHALPIFHTHGLFVACNMALTSGATMLFLTRFDAEEIIDEMADATVLMGVPTFYTRLLKSPRLDPLTTASMRLFVSGSAPLPEEVHARFAERTGHTILERYGMTETCMIASNPYEGERRVGAVGFPLPQVQVRITDRESGNTLPRGQTGAIEVAGPNVFQGYWRMPEKTAAEFRDDGYFITGDLGRIDADGYLHIVGRDKDLVITGGYNVYPKEIETLIDALPEVAESAVIGVPHPDFGEGVTAVVVPQPGASLNREQLLAALSDTLARYKQPKQMIVVNELPRNVMGKVQKNDLRKRFADLYAPSETATDS